MSLKSIYFTEIKISESKQSELIQHKYNVVAENKKYIILDDSEFSRIAKFNSELIFQPGEMLIGIVFFKSIFEKRKCINIKCYHSGILNNHVLSKIKIKLLKKIEEEVFYFKGLEMLIKKNFEEWKIIN